MGYINNCYFEDDLRRQHIEISEIHKYFEINSESRLKTHNKGDIDQFDKQ